MDYIYVAVLILVLFNTTKNAKYDNADIISMVGCNVSLTWILQITRKEVLGLRINSSNEKQIATVLADQKCYVRDNSSMLCNTNSTDDGLFVVLNIFNVTAGQSGNYTLWKKAAFLEQPSNTFKKLVVIGKPKIMDVQKPILGLPFQMTCNTIHEQEYYLYRWRINDIERKAVYNLNSYTISSLGMNDNVSNVTCQVCFNETASNLSSVTCENDRCSMDSDPYTIQVIYGPDNVSLSRGERHFYLKEHDIFMIDCLANCYPNCIFWWKGRVTIESQKLNIIFESRMDGQYACHVTNQQTNITLISDHITLHHVMEDRKPPDDNMRESLSMGLVAVAVLLVVIGLLLVRQWRKNPSDKKDSRKLSQVCVQTQTEVSQTELERHNRHAHIPSNKGRECKRTRQPPEDNCRPNILEDQYNTIDDDALSDDDFRMDLLIHKQSQETRRNTEHIHYDYAYSIGICHVETAFTHVVGETSLTQSSDCVCPVEIFQDEGNEVPDTDQSYLTVIDDPSHSVEVSQVEETDVNDLYKTNISPLNE